MAGSPFQSPLPISTTAFAGHLNGLDSVKIQQTVNTLMHAKDVAVPIAHTNGNVGSKFPSPVRTDLLKHILNDYHEPEKTILIEGFLRGFRIHCYKTPITKFYKKPQER